VTSDRSRVERIARARSLAGQHPDAAELLTFVAELTEYQQSLARRWSAAAEGIPHVHSLRDGIDREWILGNVPDTLAWLERTAPSSLAGAAAELRGVDALRWHEPLDEVLTDSIASATALAATRQLVIEALLQPMAEQLAETAVPTHGGADATRCTFCGTRPVVGALCEDGQGAKRTLTCALCARTWTYLRLVCPACGERTFEALPVYTAEQFPNARIEACDTCRTYLKTIDLTKDGLAVPLVDDIASVALDLWARDKGYVRLRANVLRT
jgi:FdhE protein